MSEAHRLPAGVRHTLTRALDLIGELQAPERLIPEEREMLLADPEALVSAVYDEVRGAGLTQREEAVRVLGAANGSLQYLTDVAQRDARARLREAGERLRLLL